MFAGTRAPRSIMRRLGLAALTMTTAAALSVTLVPAQAGAAPRPEEEPPTPGLEQLEPGTEIHSIAQDASQAVSYSLAAVAADLDADYPDGTIERTLQRGLLTLPADRLDPIVRHARDLVADPDQRGRYFGRFARLNADEFRRLGFTGAFDGSRINAERLRAEIQVRADALARTSREMETDALRRAHDVGVEPIDLRRITELDLRVEKLTCVEETTPTYGGDDEMLLGGVESGIAHDTNYSNKVGPWLVGGTEFFYSGRSYTWSSPGKQHSHHDLTTDGVWPRAFTSVVMIAEKDGTGFSDALTETLRYMRFWISAVIATAVGIVGIAFVTAVIGVVTGLIVGFLAFVLISLIINAFEDDLFEAQTTTVTLPSPYAYAYDDANGFAGGRTPSTTMTFVGHGGRYKARMHWGLTI